MELSKEFMYISFCSQVDQMNEEQAKSMLKSLYQAYLAQQETYNQLIGHKWGIIPEELG